MEERPKMLSFPNTRSVLWDQRPKGQPTVIHLSEYRNPLLVLEEKTLWLMQRFAAQDAHSDDYRCVLVGSVASDPDGEGIRICLDRLDPNVGADTESMPGELSVPCVLKKNAARSDLATPEDYSKDIKVLHQRVLSKDKVDLSRFLALRAYCSYHVNQQNHIFHIDVDLTSLAVAFRATPINPVPVVPTALSKNLSGPLSLSELQGEPKTGYLTMDQTRKLVLVLESDPKVATLPLVGIWLSGIHSIHDPFVWASCLRYLYNSSLQDRVCRPPEAFLVVLYSPLHSQPEFYSCVTADSKTALNFSLSTCHEVISLPKDSPVRPRSPLEVELVKTEHGNKLEVFQSALQENSDLMTSPSSKNTTISSSLSGSTEEIVPRSSPAPHLSKGFLSMVRPSVPEVSLLMDENEQQRSLHKSQPQPSPYPGSYAPAPQPPYPAAFKEKKSKKKKPPDGSSARGPLKQLNGVPQYASPPTGYGFGPQGQWTTGPGPQQAYGIPGQQAPQSWTPQQWAGPPPQPQMTGPRYPAQPNPTPQAYGAAGNVPQYQPQPLPPHSGVVTPMQPHPQYSPVPTSVPNFTPRPAYPNTHFNQSLPAYSTQGIPQHQPVNAHSQSLSYQPQMVASNYRPPPTSSTYNYNSTTPAPPPQQQQQPPQRYNPPPPAPPAHQQPRYNPPPPTQQTQQPPAPNQYLSYPPQAVPQPNPQATQVPQPSPTPVAPTQPQNQTPQPVVSAEVTQSSGLDTPVKDASSSSHSSPVSAAASVNASQVPPEVYELLKQQDTQLKELREQLSQLLSKQSKAEGTQPLTLKEVMSTATQMSATASPVKKGKAVCEIAVNTSLFWPHQDAGAHNTTAQSSQAREQVFDQSQNRSGSHLQPRESSSATNTLNSSQRSQNDTQFVHPGTLNQSQRSLNNTNSAMNDSKLDRSHQRQATSQNLSPPRPPSNDHSPSHGMNDAINQALSNETCSLSELQLGNLHDRTEDSYMSMVVDMPGCPSLSPEKSPHGGSSGYGDDDSNRSPVLGESVSMYEQNLNDTNGGVTRGINQSEDTGLGDSHPQVSLLYRNQHEFYNNLLGNVKKFLGKHAEEGQSEEESHNDTTRDPSPSPPRIQRKAEVDMSIDVAAQTRQQLKMLGINTEDLETNDQTFRNDTTVMFDPRLLPKINYVSMMLDSDSDLSADADSLAMKYLSDDQLAELAKMRLSGTKGKQRHKRDPALDRLLVRTDSNESTYGGISSNHMSFASKKYMERYGLLDIEGEGNRGQPHEPRMQEQRRSRPSPEMDDSVSVDPAILNAKAVLERLKESSFMNGGPTNLHASSPHSSGHSSHSSCRNSSGALGDRQQQHSVTSDTTAYHSPSHTPHRPRKQRAGSTSHDNSDRSIDSAHSAPSTPCAIHILNDSVNTNAAHFKRDRQNFNFNQRSQSADTRPKAGGRILDIERLKELPKLL